MTREQEREADKTRKMLERSGGEQARRLSRGKAKVPSAPGSGVAGSGDAEETKKLTLVVFACRHVFHRVCLDEGYRNGSSENAASGGGMYRCPVCTERER